MVADRASPRRVYDRPMVLRRLPLLGATALALLAAVVYAVASIERHRRFGSNAFDLGLYDQAIWGFSRFEPLADNTVLRTPNMFANHFQPILVVFAPLYWLWDDVRAILCAQAALLAASSLPLFLWARQVLGTPSAFLFQAAYLLFWAMLAGNLYDFHETAVAAPAIAVALYGLVTRRFGFLLGGALVALLTKEDLALTVAALGFYAAAVRLRPRASLALALGSLVWLVLAVELVIPWYSGTEYEHWLYPALGAGPAAALWHVIAHPIDTVRLFFSPEEKRVALANLLVPWLGLSLLSPLVLLAIPNLAARFLSDKEAYWSQGFHYSLMIAPVLAFAAVDATRRLVTRVPWRFAPTVVGVAAILVGAFFTLVRIDPLAELDRLPTGRVAAGMSECIDRIPGDASVAATSAVVPHLSHRRDVRLIESPRAPSAEVVAIDAFTWTQPLRSEDVPALIEATRQAGYGVVCSRFGTVVLRRGAPDGSLSPELRRLLAPG